MFQRIRMNLKILMFRMNPMTQRIQRIPKIQMNLKIQKNRKVRKDLLDRMDLWHQLHR
jgi:hypothetical protein